MLSNFAFNIINMRPSASGEEFKVSKGAPHVLLEMCEAKVGPHG